MNNIEKIQFINHASVIIKNDNISLLTDPWYEGDVFNKGWRLLQEFDTEEVVSTIEKIDYIWLSHEHPDHFSIIFFKKYGHVLKENNIKVIFQYTLDRRVASFLKSLDLEVIELKDNEELSLDKNFKIKIIKVDFYDSALVAQINDIKIVNFNDCPIQSEKELKIFKRKSGKADVILSQFSYAAWKGGKENIMWRKNAAEEKLAALEKQAKILECKTIIPFASFIYFSNDENFYLNDSINDPKKINDYFRDKPYSICIMRPFETQKLNNLVQSKKSIDYWCQKFKNISCLKKDRYMESFKLDDLKIEHLKYKEKVLNKNNALFINFLTYSNFFKVFSKINIKLYDLNIIINYSFLNGIILANDHDYEVAMHSSSLIFIFRNEFGFDTLTVNGNFETNKDGFQKMVKSFAIGSLNAMGLSLSVSALLRPDVFLLLLRKLTKVSVNLE